MADARQIASESSPDAGLITSADVDFASFEQARSLERLGKTPEPEKEPEAKPDKQAAVPATAEKGEAQVDEPADKPKPAPSISREDVQREIDARLAALPKPEPKKEEPKDDPFPTLADPQFKTVEECEAAQAKWIERQTEKRIADALAKRDEATKAQEAQRTEIETRKKAWEDRETEARTRIKDYDELKKAGESRPFNETALQFIVESKIGPDLFAHYVRNEQEWNDLIALPPEDIRVEMRMMERELRRTLNANPPQKTKTISDAPPPARIIGGAASPADDPKEKAVIEGDVDSYSRLRQAERERDTLGRFR